MKNIPLDILLFIAGMFFYGVRNMVGKWMVTALIKLLKKVLLKSEHDVALFLHHRNREARKRALKRLLK